jgi:hypothetical protein
MKALLPLILLGMVLATKSEDELPPGADKMSPPWVNFREKDLHFKHIRALSKVLKEIRGLTQSVQEFGKAGASKVQGLTNTVHEYLLSLLSPEDASHSLDDSVRTAIKKAEKEVQKAHRLL